MHQSGWARLTAGHEDVANWLRIEVYNVRSRAYAHAEQDLEQGSVAAQHKANIVRLSALKF